MSSSNSETSLAELPQPYDISSAVSKAFCIDIPAATCGATPEIGSNCAQKRIRSASYPVHASYMTTNYDIQVPSQGVHGLGRSYNIGESGDNCSAVASSYYCPASNTYPYYNPHPEPAQYLYPLQQQQLQQHYPPTVTVHPVLDTPLAHMDMEAWNETAAMSICNSSSNIFDSQENIEQLDKFCKYIDSSGDEEFMADKDSSGGEGCSEAGCSGEGCGSGNGGGMFNPVKNRYECFITGNLCSEMLDSPPKKKRRSACAMSMSDYFSDDLENTMDSTIVEGVFDSSEDRSWKVELDNATMWREFDMVGTEMVITKAGRRMFPTLAVQVSGLDPRDSFSVKLDILPADHRRYKYLQSEWVAVGRSDKKQIYCEYEHPDSPNSGSYWTDKVVAFKMVKLTNNKSTKSSDQIILNSMHKYLPCVKITCLKDGYTQSFSFPETTFIAVTAYQSTGVTKLKINNNPYARAFRDSLPSAGGHKTGGHFRQNSHKRTSSFSPKDDLTGDGSQSSTPSMSPSHYVKQNKPNKKGNCNSAGSVESGFESDPGNRKDSTTLNMPQTNPFHSSSSSSLMNCCWPDENNMWTPGTLIDTNSSFCSAYLESSRVAMEYEVGNTPEGEVSEGEMLETTLPQNSSINLGLNNVEASIPLIDDDVFF